MLSTKKERIKWDDALDLILKKPSDLKRALSKTFSSRKQDEEVEKLIGGEIEFFKNENVLTFSKDS
jgi:hypothetical protein